MSILLIITAYYDIRRDEWPCQLFSPRGQEFPCVFMLSCESTIPN
jgi:hypothetical protein